MGLFSALLASTMYATARALALDNDSELVVDNWTGFIRDKIYKRKFQLNDFQIQARLTSKLEILLFLLYQLERGN